MTLDISEYFRSMFENKLLVKMPEREEDHLTPATRLLEKRREMAEVESHLLAEREEFQMKMESLHQRREELERKQHQLKESILKFDKFLRENDAKRERAEKKAKDERELQKAKQKEIERLQNDIKNLMKFKDKFQQDVQKYSKFNSFLEKTVEVSDEFQEIHEIIDRYETLVTNYQDLLLIQKENEDKINNEKREFNMYCDDKITQKVILSNQNGELQTKLENAQNESHKAESEWNHIQTTAAVKTLEIGKIRMAIRNLYDLVLKHRAKEQEQEEISLDTDYQLKKVQEFVSDLTAITNEITRSEGTHVSYAAPSSS